MLYVFFVSFLAVFVSALTFFVQRRTQRKHNLKDLQKRINEIKKEMKPLYKEAIRDDEAKKKLDSLQKEMMDLSMKIMKSNFSGTIYIMVLSLFVFVFLQMQYSDKAFPVSSFLGLSPVIVWYILIVLLSGIYYKIVFHFLEKKKIIG